MLVEPVTRIDPDQIGRFPDSLVSDDLSLIKSQLQMNAIQLTGDLVMLVAIKDQISSQRFS